MKPLNRLQGIGGTDASAIVGENPFRSALDCYLEKTGLVEPQEGTFRMRMGTLMEPIIAKEYERIHGVDLYKPDPIVDREKSFFFGSPDFLLKDRSKGIEIKRVGIRMKQNFGVEKTDEIPPYVTIQAMWYIALTEIPIWDIVILTADDEYREFTIEKNDELIGNLRETCERFWVDNVSKKVPPTPQGTERERKALEKLFPENKGEFSDATDEDLEWINLLRDARGEMDTLTVRKLTAENNIKLSIGEADGLIIPEVFGGGKITWKKTKGRIKVDYKGMVADLNPPEAMIQMFTTITDGHKMFLVPRKWKDGK